MNGSSGSKPEDGGGHAAGKHRRLTPARVARGVLCLAAFLSTAFMTLVYWAPLVTGLLRALSVNHTRKLTSFIFGMWLALWPFLFEKINGTRVVFAGDKVPDGERVLLIANRRTEYNTF